MRTCAGSAVVLAVGLGAPRRQLQLPPHADAGCDPPSPAPFPSPGAWKCVRTPAGRRAPGQGGCGGETAPRAWSPSARRTGDKPRERPPAAGSASRAPCGHRAFSRRGEVLNVTSCGRMCPKRLLPLSPSTRAGCCVTLGGRWALSAVCGCTSKHTRSHAHAHSHTHPSLHIHTHTHTHTHTCIHTFAHTCTLTRTPSHLHIHTHAHTSTHSHSHTHAAPSSSNQTQPP